MGDPVVNVVVHLVGGDAKTKEAVKVNVLGTPLNLDDADTLYVALGEALNQAERVRGVLTETLEGDA